MVFESLQIRTWLIRARRPEPAQESLIVSRAGGAWHNVQEFQDWAVRHYRSCVLVENGVSFVEDLENGTRRHYEITLT